MVRQNHIQCIQNNKNNKNKQDFSCNFQKFHTHSSLFFLYGQNILSFFQYTMEMEKEKAWFCFETKIINWLKRKRLFLCEIRNIRDCEKKKGQGAEHGKRKENRSDIVQIPRGRAFGTVSAFVCQRTVLFGRGERAWQYAGECGD